MNGKLIWLFVGMMTRQTRLRALRREKGEEVKVRKHTTIKTHFIIPKMLTINTINFVASDQNHH